MEVTVPLPSRVTERVKVCRTNVAVTDRAASAPASEDGPRGRARREGHRHAAIVGGRAVGPAVVDPAIIGAHGAAAGAHVVDRDGEREGGTGSAEAGEDSGVGREGDGA